MGTRWTSMTTRCSRWRWQQWQSNALRRAGDAAAARARAPREWRRRRRGGSGRRCTTEHVRRCNCSCTARGWTPASVGRDAQAHRCDGNVGDAQQPLPQTYRLLPLHHLRCLYNRRSSRLSPSPPSMDGSLNDRSGKASRRVGLC